MENNASKNEHPGLEGENFMPQVADNVKAGLSMKAMMGIGVIVASVLVGGYALVQHLKAPNPQKIAKEEAEKGPKAASEAGVVHQFDPTKLPDGAPEMVAAGGVNAYKSKVPAVDGATDDMAGDPIGVRGNNSASKKSAGGVQGNGQPKQNPLDAPALLGMVSNTDSKSGGGSNNQQGSARQQQSDEDPSVRAAKDRLGTLQDTMKGLLGNLSQALQKKPDTAVTGQAPAKQETPALGGRLTGSTAHVVAAGTLGDRSLMLPKGTTFTCALKTRIVSEQAGFVSCQVLRNVYSDDGRVLLVDRGSHMDGEYTARVAQGQSRIFVVWTRLRTPEGVTVDIESPATGPLGEAGVDGYVDNHWVERFGAAWILSVMDAAVKIEVAKSHANATTEISGESSDAMSKMAEKALDATINMPPTIYKNQGEVVGIYVAKDVDFSTVYDLRTVAR